MPSLEERYTGCIAGLAVGDAVGTTVEFRPRGSFPPVTDMVGGGPFRLQVGQWTDDTSMALCLAESLLAKKGFDALDQMGRYLNWPDTPRFPPPSCPRCTCRGGSGCIRADYRQCRRATTRRCDR